MTEPQQPYQGPPPVGPAYAPQPAPPKRRVWPWVLGGTAMLALLFCGGCFAFVGGVANEVDKAANEKHTIVYEVEGSLDALSITYSATDSGGTEQLSSAKLPWKKEVTSKGLWNAYSLVAQAQTGEITCRITIDGKKVTEKTSKGEGAIVTCDASSDDLEAK